MLQIALWGGTFPPFVTDRSQPAYDDPGGRVLRVGYRRVSSADQRLDRQDLGTCDKVLEDRAAARTAIARMPAKAIAAYLEAHHD